MVVEISDWNDLDNVRNDLTGDYVLVNGLDSDTNGYAGIGDEFKRIATRDSPFSGNFDGGGFSIQDFILGDDGEDFRGHGLFSHVGDGGLVEDLSISGVVDVTNFAADTDFFTASIAGLVAESGTGTIQNCVSHVDVTALDGDQVGGLVGRNVATVTDSYATGSVEGDDTVGGLVGENRNTIQTSYAVGLVTGNEDVGGLVGADFGDVISDSYWDTEATGQSTSDGGTGLTTAEMQGSEAETNMDFDFVNVWATVEPETIETDTINGQITLDEVAAETATVILHNFSEPESIGFISEDGYPILLSVDEDEQLDSQGVLEEQGNIAQTETDTDGNYSADIPGATGDTIAIAVDFDDGTDRYGRLVTTVLE